MAKPVVSVGETADMADLAVCSTTETCTPSSHVRALCLLALLAIVPILHAQPNPPHLAYVFPAGGQQGTSFQVKLGGQFLNAASDVYISGTGVTATIVEFMRPMTPMQATQLRERMQELQKQPPSAAVQKELADIRRKLSTFNRGISPVLAENVVLQVTVAPDAEPDLRELKLATPQGLSNPIVFAIGQLPEFVEKQSEVRILTAGLNAAEVIAAESAEMRVTLPVTVNGRIVPRAARPQQPPVPGQQFTPGDADRYRFQARKGQQLVIATSARELIPYLADAVPGWFQAALTLYDDKGNEVAYDDDYRFNPDPVLHYEVPKDGEYVLEIKDALYRGREDFVYRIAMGELPFITSIYPPGGQAGAETTVSLTGWNLPVKQLKMDAKDKAPGIYPLSVRGAELVSNRVPFAVDALPAALEKEPNSSAKTAQRVTLPAIVNGRIDQPGDWDVFAFEGRAGQQIVAEVEARRLDSPLDSVLKLTDAAGKQLAFNDDHDDKGFGLLTHQADSYIRATLPANGTYHLYIGDTEQKGGAEYTYRLRISPPRPDFELRVTPSSINAPGGMTVPLTAYALRRDGFSGDIALSLRGTPRALIMTGGLIPAGQDQVRLTLTVPPGQRVAPLNLIFQGRATIQGREVVKQAVPGDDMMQAFAYHHLVPAAALVLGPIRRAMPRLMIRVPADQTVKISAGGTARIRARVQLPPNANLGEPQLELSEPPEGLTLRDSTVSGDGAEIVLQADALQAKPGVKGNLIINLSAERQVTPPNGGAPRKQRVDLGTLPAIPFEIVRP